MKVSKVILEILKRFPLRPVITGLMVELRKIIETGRLAVVA